MTELREKIADVLWPGLRERMAVSKWPHLLEPVLGDMEAKAARILGIPEIANGQALLLAKMDELGIGKGFVKIERIDPTDVYIEPEPQAENLTGSAPSASESA